jgi:hypothetical protein
MFDVSSFMFPVVHTRLATSCVSSNQNEINLSSLSHSITSLTGASRNQNQNENENQNEIMFDVSSFMFHV